MIGDKLIINDYHRTAAAAIYKRLQNILEKAREPVAVTVAGESGCGKSETAAVLASLCEEAGSKALILQQDDYFVYPPRTNHARRLEDIGWVGPQEVRLSLIDANLQTIKAGKIENLTKPLVDYDRDIVLEEIVPLAGVAVVVVEGTYTTTLENVDLKAFIDRNYRQTKKARMLRSRDPKTAFLEKVLAIEHEIISGHKKLAHVIIPAPENEREGAS